jgi:hypothetical protein
MIVTHHIGTIIFMAKVQIPQFELYEMYSISLESLRKRKPIITHTFGPKRHRYYYIYG